MSTWSPSNLQAQLQLASTLDSGDAAQGHLRPEPWTASLAHGRNSRVFQHMTVFDILDCVFAPWQSKGGLAPCWRFDISERNDFPVRSLTMQDQESDLAFAERLMSEEGLRHYFARDGDQGSHTLIITDHDGCGGQVQRSNTEIAFG